MNEYNKYILNRFLNEIDQNMLVKLLPLVVSLAILMFIGIVGNSIVIQVYGQRQEKSQTSHFIQSLAACNLIGCLLHMPYVIIYCVLWYSFPHHILCRAFEWLHHAQVIAVSFILLSMTLDRLLRSIRKQKCISSKTAKQMCIWCMIGGAILAFPIILIFGDRVVDTPIQGLEGTRCGIQPFYESTKVVIIFQMGSATFFLLFYLFNIVSYALIIKSMQIRQKTHPMPKFSEGHVQGKIKHPHGVMKKRVNDNSMEIQLAKVPIPSPSLTSICSFGHEHIQSPIMIKDGYLWDMLRHMDPPLTPDMSESNSENEINTGDLTDSQERGCTVSPLPAVNVDSNVGSANPVSKTPKGSLSSNPFSSKRNSTEGVIFTYDFFDNDTDGKSSRTVSRTCSKDSAGITASGLAPLSESAADTASDYTLSPNMGIDQTPEVSPGMESIRTAWTDLEPDYDVEHEQGTASDGELGPPTDSEKGNQCTTDHGDANSPPAKVHAESEYPPPLPPPVLKPPLLTKTSSSQIKFSPMGSEQRDDNQQLLAANVETNSSSHEHKPSESAQESEKDKIETSKTDFVENSLNIKGLHRTLSDFSEESACSIAENLPNMVAENHDDQDSEQTLPFRQSSVLENPINLSHHSFDTDATGYLEDLEQGRKRMVHFAPMISVLHAESGKQSHELCKSSHTAMMLFLAVLVYSLCWLPYWIIQVLIYAKQWDVSKPEGASFQIYMLLTHLPLLSDAVNPIIYWCVNKTFRIECARTFRKCGQRY